MAQSRSEYVAALCHMRDGSLSDYDSTRILAETQEEAKKKAQEWAVAALGTLISEPTWLQVTDAAGKGIMSKPYGTLNA